MVSGSISCRGILLSDGCTFFAAGDSCGRSACSALFARRDGDGLAAPTRAVLRRALMGGWGGRRETAHNVTAAADYRTALLSDSP